MNLNPPVLPISPSMGSSQLDPSNPNPNPNSPQHPPPPPAKKKRNLPGTPDPDAEVIALSPRSLMATNRFVCEVCGKGFQRDQNLQLHRRGHNLPWRLRQRGVGKEAPRKKVYLCPVETCVHHDPSRALGDLTGIKKHYSRKHGEKKWKCHKCNKRYAVQSDWKAHSKTCGTKEYSCDCGTVFSRKDSFVTHRAFCDALVQETARLSGDGDPRSGSFAPSNGATLVHHSILHQRPQIQEHKSIPNPFLLDHSHQLSTMQEQLPNSNLFIPQILQVNDSSMPIFPTECKAPAPATTGAYNCLPGTPSSSSAAAAAMSATALLQKATQIGSSASQASPPSLFAGIGGFSGGNNTDGNTCFSATGRGSSPVGDEFGGCTRDFLGVGTEECCLKRPPPELAGFEGMCSAMDVFGASLGYRS